MRRFLSLALLCVLGLAPVAALLPGADQAALPMCCRRHGAHHCVMAMANASQTHDSGPAFSAPDRCPRYSVQVRATTPPFVFPHFAIAHAHAALRLRRAPACVAVVRRTHTHAGRGPPILS